MDIPKKINLFNIESIISQTKAELQESLNKHSKSLADYNKLAVAEEGLESVLDIIKEYNRDIAYYTNVLKPGLEEDRLPINKVGTFEGQPEEKYKGESSFRLGELYTTITKIKRFAISKAEVNVWKRLNTPIAGTVLFIYL